MDNQPFEDEVRRIQDRARDGIADLARFASQAQRQYLTSPVNIIGPGIIEIEMEPPAFFA